MRYIFVVQGEGRGHLTQAIALSEILQQAGHEVVEVLVGKCSNRELPDFFRQKINAPVKRFNSPSLDYGRSGKSGKIIRSVILNTTPTKIAKYSKSINTIIGSIKRHKPDAIINLYDVLMGIASLMHNIDAPIINIAHQFLIDHPSFPNRLPNETKMLAIKFFNSICSIGATKTLALSLYPLKDSYRRRIAVVPPLLREEIFKLKPTQEDHLLGYMLNTAYLDDVMKWQYEGGTSKIELFWDKKDAPKVWKIKENVVLNRIDDTKFLENMASCRGYITTAGFESVCEAYYLGKPVLMIPSHIEQQINALDASRTGVGISSKNFDVSLLDDYIPKHNSDNTNFKEWVDSAKDIFLKHLTTFV